MHLFTAYVPVHSSYTEPHSRTVLRRECVWPCTCMNGNSTETCMNGNSTETCKTEQTITNSLGSRICAGVKCDIRLQSSFVIGGMGSPLNY